MAPSTPRPYRAAIRRHWPRAEFLGGAGPWATVSECAPIVSVELHRTAEAARATLDFINTYACGHACCRQHRIVELRRPRGTGGAQ